MHAARKLSSSSAGGAAALPAAVAGVPSPAVLLLLAVEPPRAGPTACHAGWAMASAARSALAMASLMACCQSGTSWRSTAPACSACCSAAAACCPCPCPCCCCCCLLLLQRQLLLAGHEAVEASVLQLAQRQLEPALGWLVAQRHHCCEELQDVFRRQLCDVVPAGGWHEVVRRHAAAHHTAVRRYFSGQR